LSGEGRIVWIAVDEDPERVRAFRVHNVPTLIALRGERVVARRAGALSPGQFHAFVHEAGLGPSAEVRTGSAGATAPRTPGAI